MKCTKKGRVVYDRKTHSFSIKDLVRITEHINNNFGVDELRGDAGSVRYIYVLAQNMFKSVADLFYPVNVSGGGSPRRELQERADAFLRSFAEGIATGFGYRVDAIIPGAGIIAEEIMKDTGNFIIDIVENIGWPDYNKRQEDKNG